MNRMWDVIVAGGGILGLATAMTLLEQYPRLRLLVVEREKALATQQTGHNSGVLHAGVYYAPGSMKARYCVAGRRRLVRFCEQHNLPFEICGKLIVALNAAELARLDELHRRALANGVEGVEMMEPARFREIEPHVAGIRALHVRSTGIIDFVAVARAYAAQIEARGGTIRVAAAVHGVERRADGLVVKTACGDEATRGLIACGGLYSDRIAAGCGAPADLRIVPFRGDYYELTPAAAQFCRALIYPVPDPRFPFLGVHFTRLIDGRVLAGPNAVLAFARQGYRRTDVDLGDLADALSWPGFWRMAARYWRTGLAEMWRDYCKRAYVRTMQEYLPAIRDEDVCHGPAGVRAQAVTRGGALVDDFSFHVDDRMLHVRNAPSPAATSSLAIAEAIVDQARSALRLEK